MLAPAPNRCLSPTTAIGGLLMSLWLAVCPIVALAVQSPQVNRLPATAPEHWGQAACYQPVDAGDAGTNGTERACCCLSQACQCCHLSVDSSSSPIATTVSDDSIQTAGTPNTGIACDCGCQRPLLPPAIPGVPNSSVLLWMAWRDQPPLSLGFVDLHLNPPSTFDSNRNARDRGHWLSDTASPGQRQATLNRWLI